MADTGEGIVYGRREGSGLAQVFGQPVDPLASYYKRVREKQQQDLLAAEQARLAKEKRDKELWELQNVSPGKAWEPFNKEVYNDAKNLRNETAALALNGNIDKTYIKNRWDEINLKAEKSLHYKQLRDDAIKSIEDSPYQKGRLKDFYMPQINDVFFDEYGNARPMDQIDEEKLNAITQDPGGFDLSKYADDFTANPKESITSKVKYWKDANGVSHSDDYEVKYPSEFYTVDFDSPSGVVKDLDGQDRITISQNAVDMFVDGDPLKKQAILNEAQQRGMEPTDVVKDYITKAIRRQKAGPEFHVTPHERADSKWMDYMMGGRMKPAQVKVANQAFERIGSMVNGFIDANGNRTMTPTPEAKAAAGNFKGRRALGGVVEESELIPGTNKSGNSVMFGKLIKNSPHDRIVFNVKVGTSGNNTVMDFDLTDPGTPATLWNILAESGHMGKTGKEIGIDQAAEELGVDLPSLYKGHEYLGENEEKEQKQIEKWAKGVDYTEMMGGSYKGQEIKKIDPDKTLIMREPTGNYTLTLADGSEVELSKDDADAFTEISRSKYGKPSATTPAPYKPTPLPKADVKVNAPAKVVPKGSVKMVSPDGTVGFVSADQVPDFEAMGYKRSK